MGCSLHHCRYLTTLQMLQFVCVIIHGLLPSFYQCGYPNIVPKVSLHAVDLPNKCLLITTKYLQIIVANAVIFFILFANFYFFAYINKKKKTEKEVQ